MSRKKKFLIIFFSILSILVLYFTTIIIVGVIIENSQNEIIEKYLSSIPNDNHFIYKYFDSSIIYENEYLNLEKYIDKKDIYVEYVNENYLIYSKRKSHTYSYYVIDSDGNSYFLFKKDERVRWNYYNEGNFYIEGQNEFYSYDINQNDLITITYDEYFSANDNKYQAVQYDKKQLKITDVDNGLYKYFSLDHYQQNDIIEKLLGLQKKLEMHNFLVVGEDIYILVYVNYTYAVVIKYDFQMETISFVDKIINGYKDDKTIMFYLENQKCYPLDAIISKK
ncbi:hypothetical protein EI71_00801 [Anaeroplasma bactoclasticum]|uniref:Uncharacterized protein n=1 Tax=Anaeroplasma bactoclasticum TaxID=2088 RepID=A0A397S0A5_9MOLU|nr:hypothetical protein [Anaeroplasma bactoclasticum]RIA77825.1 hypothetical protein EI71_00801 [Anaeroplasma bactoclasticum]